MLLDSPGEIPGLAFVRRPAAVCGYQVRRFFVVKLRLREKESIQEAVRRFRKLVEHSGIKKEMRRREFYEKPSDKRRRARRRAERRARMARMPLT
jgi:small subunit ribosomal protein S21